MTPVELRARGVGVDKGGRALFDDVNLLVSAGQMLVITGASGTGKSTLALILAGITTPSRGDVTLNDTPLRALSNFADVPSLVTQDLGLISTLTAVESIALPLQVQALAKEEVRERTALWLGALGLEACAHHPVEELSGGQQQRVAIARAMVGQPQVLLADEPTGNLDSQMGGEVMDHLVTLNQTGTTVIMVTHDEHEAKRGSHIVRVFDGQLVA